MMSARLPGATTWPAWPPAPGPRSTIWSAWRIASSSCSTTITGLPRSRSRLRGSSTRRVLGRGRAVGGRDIADPADRGGDRQVGDAGNVLAADFDAERLGLEPLAIAGLA